MSLADILNDTKKNFDPKKDSINGSYDKLPEGTYLVTLDNINHGTFATGYENLSFKMTVIDGEYASRVEFVGVNLATEKKDGSPMPGLVVTKNMRLLVTIGALVGLTITDEMVIGNVTDVYEKLVKAFLPYKGKLLEMTIKESANKKDPDNPYRNYEFAEASEGNGDPFKKRANDNIEISDDDMPF